MTETILNECVITGSMLNKSVSVPLKGTIEIRLGKKFNHLTVVSKAAPEIRPNGRWHNTCWTCRCDCGTIITLRGCDLRGGWTKACGKCRYESTRKRMRHPPYHWILAILNAKSSSVTYEELLEFTRIKRCHYCDESIEWYEYPRNAQGRKSHKYNLDRKDNLDGYSKENCVVCCSACNYLKGDKFTYEEMMELGKTLRKLREDRHRKNLPWIQYYRRSQN